MWCYGVVAFIDVSGFSSVASVLEDQLEGGAGYLPLALNDYFAKIIATVEDNGGDVVNFSGDALTAVWKYQGNIDAISCVARAVYCCTELQTMHESYTFQSMNVDNGSCESEFTIHIGISMGSICCGIIGGRGSSRSGKWKVFVGGAAINDVGIAASNAPEHCIVITAPVLRHLRQADWQVQVRDCTECGYHMLLMTEPPSKLVSKRPEAVVTPVGINDLPLFVFDTVTWAIRRGIKGELRTISIVFIKLGSHTDCDFDDESFLKISRAVSRVQKLLRTSDGVLNKVVVDDKGVVLLCLFGLPLHAHEDDTQRAVSFGLKAVSRISKEKSSVKTYAGISRAKVFCGMIGSSIRKEYTVLGEGVNVASRLMVHAEKVALSSDLDTLVCADEDTFVNSGNRTCFTQKGVLIIRGSSSTIPVYHVDNESDRNSNSMSIVALEGIDQAEDDILSKAGSWSSVSSGSSARVLASRLANAGKTVSLLVCQKRDREKKACGRNRKKMSEIVTDDGWETSSSSSRSSSSHSLSSNGSLRIITKSRSRGGFSKSPRKPDKGVRHLIGRQEEMATVVRLLRFCGKPEGRLMLCVGEVQMGKTALLNAAVEQATLYGISTPWIQGTEANQYTAFGGLIPLLTAILENYSYQLLEVSFSPNLRPHIPLLNYIVRLPILDGITDEHRNMPGEEKIQILHSIVRNLIRRNFGEKSILFIDDINWLDAMSLRFVTEYVKTGGHVIAASRIQRANHCLSRQSIISSIREKLDVSSDGGSEDFSGITDPHFLELSITMNTTQYLSLPEDSQLTITLEKLSPAHHQELLCNVFGCSQVSSELEQLLYVKSDGRPGFSVQMAQALLLAGAVQIRHKAAIAVKLQDFEKSLVHTIPSLEVNVLRLIDYLTPVEGMVVSVSSVLGNRFTHQMLEECVKHLDVGSSKSTVAVQKLCDLDVLQMKGGSCRFSLPLARDVIYANILNSDKKRYHKAVMQVILSKTAYNNQAVRYHLERSEISDSVLNKMLNEQLRLSGEKGNKSACMTIALRYSMIQNELAAKEELLRAGYIYECGDEKQLVDAVLGNIVPVGDLLIPTSRCSCFSTPREIPEGLPTSIQHVALSLEIDLWKSNASGIIRRRDHLENIKESIPSAASAISQYLGSIGVVLGHRKFMIPKIDGIQSPFDLFALCTSNSCVNIIDSLIPMGIQVPLRICPILLSGDTKPPPSETVKKKRRNSTSHRYSETVKRYWKRPILKATCDVLKDVNDAILGNKLRGESLGSWPAYATVLQAASSELHRGEDTELIKTKLAWNASEDQIIRSRSNEKDGPDQLCVMISKCVGFLTQTRQQYSSKTAAYLCDLVEGMSDVYTPIHGIVIWCLCEGVLGYHCDNNNSGFRRNQSIEEMDIPNHLSRLFNIFSKLAQIYPIVSLAYQFMMGRAADGNAEAIKHYTNVITTAQSLNVIDTCIVWRARASIVLSEPSEDGLKNACLFHSTYKPHSCSQLRDQLQSDLRFAATVESKMLSECIF